MKLKYVIILVIVIPVILGIIFVPYIISEDNQGIYLRSKIEKPLNLYVDNKNVGVAINSIREFIDSSSNHYYSPAIPFSRYEHILKITKNEKKIVIQKGKDIKVSFDNMPKPFKDISYVLNYVTKNEEDKFVDYCDPYTNKGDIYIPTSKLEVGKSYGTAFKLTCAYGILEYVFNYEIVD